ncbi:hypothetical protein M3P36_00660 [Altererythrobacter sp. KTW20L]|uniref:hypothetical protein n=1 Tax=Altererythrobacter sp. KTW20L TaxID=2942210 RepID=UPI0020BF5BFB|nr:hypothetical protein [Altererythrobacter sp. KTW20L]MCL6249560.1 hypothetical protein [Altererythrobacter sp. KTW20L]
MKYQAVLAAAVLALAPAAALAQAQGETVTGNDGNPVGTVMSNDGSTVMVDTGTHQVPLPADVFATTDTGPTLNTTKAELDSLYAAQLAEAAAARDAALVAGAAVVTADAQALGSVDTIDGDNIVIREGDFVVTLPRDLLALNGNGQLMALANHADIMAALEAAQGG